MQTRKNENSESDEDRAWVSLKLFVFVYGKESITVWEERQYTLCQKVHERNSSENCLKKCVRLWKHNFDVKMSEKVSIF